MVVIDSSAIVGIVLEEPDADALLNAVTRYAGTMSMAAATFVETFIVLASRRPAFHPADLLTLLETWKTEIVPVDLRIATLASDAFRRFGKGRHPAALNFGDCFSYALARSLDAPLLFKGDDFARTDVRPAL